ncbi:MAG: uracil-DNA glycosylase [Planctomycetaceae bacterium]
MDDAARIARDLARTVRARALFQGRRRASPAPPPTSRADPARDLEAVSLEAKACRRCGLCETRTQVVFGEGNPSAQLMFVGEAPGQEEDEQGRPFVGRAGRLLNDMIRGMGLQREEVYICNVLKCRPPGNRAPGPDEVESCRPFLRRQIDAVAPKVLCALGSHATRALLGRSEGITKLRGKVFPELGTRIVPTFHPAYLLRNPAAKREAWEDLKLVLGLLGRPVPPPSGRDR